MRIAMDDRIICVDGEVGCCKHVIVDPVALKVTHIVVGEGEVPPRPPRPPRLTVEDTEHAVVIKRPHVVLETDQNSALPRPPHLHVEEDERQATITVPHLTFEEDEAGHADRLLPFDKLVASTAYGIWIDCTAAELATMDDFLVRSYETVDMPDYQHSAELWALTGHVVQEHKVVPIDEWRVPPHEVVLNGSTAVEAADGTLGRVGELVVESGSGRITRVTVREGHLWNEKDVAVPAALIDRISEAEVHLRLDRQDLAALASSDVDLELGMNYA